VEWVAGSGGGVIGGGVKSESNESEAKSEWRLESKIRCFVGQSDVVLEAKRNTLLTLAHEYLACVLFNLETTIREAGGITLVGTGRLLT
jgi:hypothetical protein